MLGFAVVGVAVCVAAAGASTSRSRLAPIQGKLSEGGYTVIALAYNGKAVTAKGSAFSVVPPAGRVTLQLVDAHGKYAGPVVVGGRGSRIYEGVKAGAKLGKILVMNGYAVVAGRVAKGFVDTTRWAHAVNGVPVGSGLNFGLVRIAGKDTGSSAPGGDLAHSGVPNDISIDPAANGQITALAPASELSLTRGARVADSTAAAADASALGINIGNEIGVPLYGTQNVDIAGTTLADIDASLVGEGESVSIGYPSSGPSLIELNCDGLPYCSPGGSGHLNVGTSIPGAAFPSCCNPSGDGFGQLGGEGGAAPFTTIGDQSYFGLFTEATSEQIGTGDTMVVNVTQNGTVTQVPLTLPFVFITEAALDSWSDGAGHGGTIAYAPEPRPYLTGGPPLEVAASASGDVILTLTWWRPQRAGITAAGEPAFMDIGHLAYSFAVSPSNADPNAEPAICDPATTMTTSDPNLAVQPVAQYPGGPTQNELVDLSGDQPSNSANTLTASLDITKCLAAAGETFSVGENLIGALTANTQTGDSDTVVKFTVKRIS